MKKVSLVVPFYNESCRFDRFGQTMLEYLGQPHPLGELILVDDGSTDGTARVLKAFARQCPLPCRVLELTPNRGKGHAVKQGVMAASHPWILCMDADLAYRPEQLDEWISHQGLDLERCDRAWFGSRELGMRHGWVTYQLHRRVLGRIYALMIRVLTGISETDTQCGFKLYPAEMARRVFSQVRQQRFAYDVEVHYLLKKMNQPPRMIPVRCDDHGDSRVDLLRDSLQMGLALLTIPRRKKADIRRQVVMKEHKPLFRES